MEQIIGDQNELFFPHPNLLNNFWDNLVDNYNDNFWDILGIIFWTICGGLLYGSTELF